MKNAASLIQHHLTLAVKELYGLDISDSLLPITPTRKEFQGDFTVVTFPLTKLAKKRNSTNPAITLAWLILQPGVITPVASGKSLKLLNEIFQEVNLTSQKFDDLTNF